MASVPLPVQFLTAVVLFPNSARYLPAFSRLQKVHCESSGYCPEYLFQTQFYKNIFPWSSWYKYSTENYILKKVQNHNIHRSARLTLRTSNRTLLKWVQLPLLFYRYTAFRRLSLQSGHCPVNLFLLLHLHPHAYRQFSPSMLQSVLGISLQYLIPGDRSDWYGLPSKVSAYLPAHPDPFFPWCTRFLLPVLWSLHRTELYHLHLHRHEPGIYWSWSAK